MCKSETCPYMEICLEYQKAAVSCNKDYRQNYCGISREIKSEIDKKAM